MSGFILVKAVLVDCEKHQNKCHQWKGLPLGQLVGGWGYFRVVDNIIFKGVLVAKSSMQGKMNKINTVRKVSGDTRKDYLRRYDVRYC